MKTRRLLFASIAVALVVIPAAWSASTAHRAKGDTLVVGTATGQTGFLAPYDQPALQGFKLGVDEINAKGGIGGKFKIEVKSKDTRSDAAQTAIATQELIDSGVNVIVLPSDGDPAIAGGQLSQKA